MKKNFKSIKLNLIITVEKKVNQYEFYNIKTLSIYLSNKLNKNNTL